MEKSNQLIKKVCIGLGALVLVLLLAIAFLLGKQSAAKKTDGAGRNTDSASLSGVTALPDDTTAAPETAAPAGETASVAADPAASPENPAADNASYPTRVLSRKFPDKRITGIFSPLAMVDKWDA